MRSHNAVLAAGALALIIAATAPGARAEELDTAIFIEINDTDGDAGIQLFVDGEGWKKLQVFAPDGRKVLDIRGKGSVGLQGITELAFESAEPSFDVQPLDAFLALFPEGEYPFMAITTDGEEIQGEATLTHALPDAPVQILPAAGDDGVDPEETVLQWHLVADPAGSAIVGYEVILQTEDDPVRTFKVDVSSTTTSVTVPPEFMEEGTEYKWEVLAIEEGGNKTISESDFETSSD